jgi:hypothetical protein
VKRPACHLLAAPFRGNAATVLSHHKNINRFAVVFCQSIFRIRSYVHLSFIVYYQPERLKLKRSALHRHQTTSQTHAPDPLVAFPAVPLNIIIQSHGQYIRSFTDITMSNTCCWDLLMSGDGDVDEVEAEQGCQSATHNHNTVSGNARG